MLAAERRNEILALLKEEGRVIVADLSKKYDVTEETIRRDLEKLENDGFAERTVESVNIDIVIERKSN